MKKNIGFTLVELLAVITILGIIGLISIPIISNLTKNSQQKAFVQTVEGVIEATKVYNANTDYLKMTDDKKIDILNSDIDFDNKSNIQYGYISYNSTTESYTFYIEGKNYCATGTNKDYNVYAISDSHCNQSKYSDYISRGAYIYLDPSDLDKVCTSYNSSSYTYAYADSSVITGCMRWYAIEYSDSSNQYASFILDHNIKYSTWMSDAKLFSYLTNSYGWSKDIEDITNLTYSQAQNNSCYLGSTYSCNYYMYINQDYYSSYWLSDKSGSNSHYVVKNFGLSTELSDTKAYVRPVIRINKDYIEYIYNNYGCYDC